MYNKKLLLFIAFILVSLKFHAQSCNITIKGSVFDEAPNTPLPHVSIFIQELAKGTISDDRGKFQFSEICPGEYHLIFSHIGCEAEKIHLNLRADTTIIKRLLHTPSSLGIAFIKGKRGEYNNQPNLSVNRQHIEDNLNQNLSGVLENEAGIHLLKNGNGISKPVIHGLYGNRLIILNNGIIQSGQQWGNDHSPEIDPFASDKITVLKGTSAIEYGGGNLGSVILVEPKRIEREPHLHGQINYTFETNGRGHSVNSRMEKYSPQLAWRMNGTIKNYGDRKTADYFLNNTGVKEANFSVQLEKSRKDKSYYDLYVSTFNTQLGILRGSHIGNLSDLEQALIRDIPFFTEPDFSARIEAPKQNVSHHLAKGKAKYLLRKDQVLELVLASQINNRKEFDVRRSGRSDIPALSLTQLTVNSEIKYSRNLDEHWKFKLGQQNISTDNRNNPETGILPLIPDYYSLKSGLFTTLSKRKNITELNVGMRYDYEHQHVQTISRTLPREIINYENYFHNFSGLLTAKIDLSKTQSISWNTGYAMRNPSINELYSNGLHQGVSGIEEGDVHLRPEKAIKNTLEYKWTPGANLSFNTLLYHQEFNGYIFLNPQDEIRLTIRGAFPVFKYEQTNARIYGFDISSQFTLGHTLFGLINYSYLKGEDTKNKMPLIFMPPNSFFGSLIYRAKKPIRRFKKISLEESEIEINNRTVFKQTNILPVQDFTPPPPTYHLLGLKVSTHLISSHYKLRCFVKANNLLNMRYRDYLNRQRYFADDLGVSLIFGVNYKF